MSQAFAAAPQLTNLSLPNVDGIMETFAALTNFRPLEPASSWAKWFGVSVGLVAQGTPARKLKAAIPNSGDVPSILPDAYAVLALDGPWGLGLEGGVFPTTTIKDITLRQYAGNLKWTINEVFFTDVLPFDWAVRAGVTDSYVAFKYAIAGTQDTINYTGTHWNFSTSISRKFWFLEPYVGAGYSTQKANIHNEGRITLLGSTFNVSTSVDRTYKSALAYVGLQTHIWFMNVTLQADYQYKLVNYAFKLAAKF